MGWLDQLFGTRSDAATDALYAAVIDRARAPHWYLEGQVPDTIDGRFDMVASILSFVLLRLERDAEAAGASARLTEAFVTDMDGQLREIGVGDVIVGKQVGNMMGMLGGRLGAYRDGVAAGNIDAVVERNIFRGAAPAGAVSHVSAHLHAFANALADTPTAAILVGQLP